MPYFPKPFTYTLYTDTVQKMTNRFLYVKMLLHLKRRKMNKCWLSSISSVDAEGAYKNLQAEMPGWNFDGALPMLRRNGMNACQRLQSKPIMKDQRHFLYGYVSCFPKSQSVYRCRRRYLGMDLKVHTTDMKHPVYTIFSCGIPLRYIRYWTIVDPQLNTEFIRSLIKKHQEGGIFPKWDCVSNYTGTMVGYHAASLVTDSYVKGYRDFDVQEAYKACLRAAEYDTTGIVAPGLADSICYAQKHVIIRILLAIFHVTVRMNRWRKHWSMRMMTGVSPCWQTAWEILKPRRSMPVLQMLTNFILILPPVSCVDWIVKVNGVLRSIPVLPITVMMIIARVLHGNGLGFVPHDIRDW